MINYARHGMTITIYYKNKKYKVIDNVVCFNLIDGDLLIWLCYKSKPLIHQMKFVTDFYCSYDKY